MQYSVSILKMRTDPWKGLLELTIYYVLQKVYHKLFIQNNECL